MKIGQMVAIKAHTQIEKEDYNDINSPEKLVRYKFDSPAQGKFLGWSGDLAEVQINISAIGKTKWLATVLVQLSDIEVVNEAA